jgi:Flp pilus assembly protein TadG
MDRASHRIGRLAARVLRRRDGNFATFTALAVIPLMAGTALAVDTAKMLNARSTLQDAADAAALAAATLPHDTPQETLEALVQSFFAANGATATFARRTEVRLTERRTFIEVRANAAVSQIFALPGRGDARPVNVMARAGKVGFGSEVAIAVDLTNSMNFGMSWPHVSDALGDMLDRMRANGPNARFRVSLVPFNDRVNLGTIGMGWLTQEALETINCPPGRTPRVAGGGMGGDDDDDDDDGDDGGGGRGNLICVPGQAPAHGLAAAEPYPRLASWAGCLEPRERRIGANRHGLDDASPAVAQFEPTADGFSGPLITELGTRCPPRAILPTGNITAIETAVNSFAPATGTGRFDEALAWGWRMVSPRWRGEFGDPAWPAAAGETNKHVMLFTDGHGSQ